MSAHENALDPFLCCANAGGNGEPKARAGAAPALAHHLKMAQDLDEQS